MYIPAGICRNSTASYGMSAPAGICAYMVAPHASDAATTEACDTMAHAYEALYVEAASPASS